MGTSCDKGYQGSCCCNCKHQLVLLRHPWNNIFKGSISEETGLYACKIFHEIDKNRKAVVYESKHGSCENWESKDEKN